MENIKENVHNDFVNLRKEKNEYFNQFYSNNYKLVYRICLSILKDVENSEDIAQTIFEKILKMDKTKYPSEYESSWLYTVAKNECLQFIRGKRDNDGEDELESAKSNTNEIEDVVDKANYESLMNKLNKKQYQIVSLKVESDFTFKEIGQMMSMPTATVQWYYYSSIKSLRAALSSMAMFIIAMFIGINYIHQESEQKQVQSKGKKYNEVDSKNAETSEYSNNGSSVIQKDSDSKKTVVDSLDKELTSASLSAEVNTSWIKENGVKVGIFSLCGILLTLSIIFSIFFIKYQQSVKRKTSKK